MDRTKEEKEMELCWNEKEKSWEEIERSWEV